MPSLTFPPLILLAAPPSVEQILVVAHRALDIALAAMYGASANGSAPRQPRQALILARPLVAAVLPEMEETRHDG